MERQVDGKPVFVYSGGKAPDPALPGVVFVHGAGMDHSIWTLQSRWFAHHGRAVLCPDLPGHGRSAGPALAGIGELADWVVRLLDAAELAKAALVGHSMGALVALEAAARHPDRVTGLGLLGIAVPMGVSEGLLNAARADDPAAFETITLWGHAFESQLGGHRVPGLWLTGQALRLLERAPPGVLYTDLNACNAYRDGLASAARVRCPALLILGGRDLMAPAKAAGPLLEALPRGRSVVLAGCGHMQFVERPDATLDALMEVA